MKETKQKIYIAGKVTGEDLQECRAKFNKKQQELEALNYEVINPMQLGISEDTTWEQAMKTCVKALIECDYIYPMPCWTRSRGANVEVGLAMNLGIETFEYKP